MTLEEFWATIDRARKAAADVPNGKYESLKAGVAELSLADVQSFERHSGECLIRAYSRELWGAARIIGGGCGDDAFRDFRSPPIMRGKDFFEAAISHPGSLADADYSEDNENNYPFYEGYSYVAQKLIEARGGEMPFLQWPKEPSGYRWREEELPRLYPKLAVKFRDNF
jgi:hypothetical protein